MRHPRILLMAAAAAVSMSTAAQGHGRWIDIQNKPGCAVWIEEPADGQTATWTGPCVDGRAQGRGVLTSIFRHAGETRQGRYEGDMKAGRPDGKGVAKWSNGLRYEGEFQADKMHGRGVLHWPNGDRYEGEFRDDKFDGEGALIWANGARFEGHFQGDRFHGPGVYIFANGSRCAGEWSYGALSGPGKGTRDGRELKCVAHGSSIRFEE